MRVGLKFHSFKTPLNEANISNIPFTKPTRTSVCFQDFIFSLKIFSDIALFVSLGINFHNFGAREEILFVPK